jgi:hypothetical protein
VTEPRKRPVARPGIAAAPGGRERDRMPRDKVHLYRGAPPVRSWSKYQTTVEEWTLCGVHRKLASGPGRRRAGCVEDASLVTCPHCLELMRPRANIKPRAGAGGGSKGV